MFGKKPAVSEEQVLSALRAVQEPDLHRDLVTLNMIKNLKIEGSKVSFGIELTTPACPFKNQMQEDARRAVAALPGVKDVLVDMHSTTTTDQRIRGQLVPLVGVLVECRDRRGVVVGIERIRDPLHLAERGVAGGPYLGLVGAPRADGDDRAERAPAHRDRSAACAAGARDEHGRHGDHRDHRARTQTPHRPTPLGRRPGRA